MRQFLLSVIIPTHNRQRYAIPTIHSILEIPGDIEIVVSDTSETDLITPAFQDHPERSRIKVLRPGRPLNVVENFQSGLSAATGTYLTFLGDDDFLARGIIPAVVWAEKNHVDAVKFSFPVQYYWPDFLHKRRNSFYAGTIHISDFTGEVKPYDSVQARRQAARNLGAGVLNMPRAYAGLISRDLASRIEQKYGQLFGGVSPDIYSAALISTEATRSVYIDYPLIIPGSSGSSTAGQSANGSHVGKLRENAHIGAFKQLEWNPLIPEFYSVPTVWSYSFIAALEKISGGMKEANFGRLYAKCLFYHRHHAEHIWASIQCNIRKNGVAATACSLFRGAARELGWVIWKVGTLIKGRLSESRANIIRQANDSRDASARVEEFLQSHDRQLRLP